MTRNSLIIESTAPGTARSEIDALIAALPPGMAHWERSPDAPLTLNAADVGSYHPGQTPRLAVAGDAARAWLAANAEHAPRPACWVQPKGAEALPVADGVPILRMNCDEDLALYLLRRTLARLCADRVTVHGVMVEVFGLGVMISGSSGQGKSELALELLTRGHGLIADDAVELIRSHPDYLIGSCPWLLRGFLEVRGLGILDVPRMFGADALRRPYRLDLIVHLYPAGQHTPDFVERLEGLRSQREILGVDTPEISLPVTVGHNLATLLEAACRDQWLRIGGYCAGQEFALRQQLAIDRSTATGPRGVPPTPGGF